MAASLHGEFKESDRNDQDHWMLGLPGLSPAHSPGVMLLLRIQADCLVTSGA